MEAYGLPRMCGVSWPDVGDIKEFGRPGGAGNLRGKGGDIRSFFRNPAAKAAIRRIYKRRARNEGKIASRI